jgi:hypothetical protein
MERAAEEVKLAWAGVLRKLRVETDHVPPDEALSSEAGTAELVRCWSELTVPERMVLGQLAIDGYPSPDPSNIRVVSALSDRGIISHSSLAIVRPGFAAFVRTQVDDGDLDAWEGSGGGTTWDMLRVPLAASVTALLAVLGNVAPEAAATGAAVPAVAAALPVVLRIITGAAGEATGAKTGE